MRIVAVADTHLFTDTLPSIPEGDLFIHAGDLLRKGDLTELEQGLDWLKTLSFQYKILVAGNHDGCFEKKRQRDYARQITREAGVIYLEDSSTTIEGIKLWGSPWQPAYNNWAFNLPRGEKLMKRWKLIPSDVDILITHSPPRGYGDRSPSASRYGCTALAQRITEVRPKLHVFGHIHQDGGLWKTDDITYLNATTWQCERAPSIIEYDQETLSIIPIHIPPKERI